MPAPLCGDSCFDPNPPTTADFRADPGWVGWNATACLGGGAGLLPMEDLCIEAPGPELYLVDFDLGVGLGGDPFLGLPWDGSIDPQFSFLVNLGFPPWVIYSIGGPGPWTMTITVTQFLPPGPTYQDTIEVRI